MAHSRSIKTVATGSIAVAVLLSLSTSMAHAQFVMQSEVAYAAGTQPSGVTAGDFDGDGDLDLATTVEGPDRIAVLINDGGGAYALGASSLLPASSSPQDLIAGDLDNDGDIDLAVAVRDPQGSVLIMANGGTGTFVMISGIAVGDRPRGLAIADIEGDGDLDLAVANRDGLSASVLTNSGAAVFASQTVNVGGETRATALGDFDGDGDADLAVTDADNRSVHLFSNNAGSFVPAGTLAVNPLVRPDGIAAANLDGTGPLDLAVATSDQTLGINTVTVFTNAAGTFSAGLAYATSGSNTSGIFAADMDCDGLVDLVTSNQDSNDISLLQNIGGAVFGPATVLGAGVSPEEIAAADLDGDGDPDVAVANRDSNDVSVFINDTCAIEPGCRSAAECSDGNLCTDDICNGALGCANPPLVCGAGQTCNPDNGTCEATGTCNADLNGDGTVDPADLAMLLGSWGPCN